MTNDLQDQLFNYMERQKIIIKKELAKEDIDIKKQQFYTGRLTAFLDVIGFIMSDGKLT